MKNLTRQYIKTVRQITAKVLKDRKIRFSFGFATLTLLVGSLAGLGTPLVLKKIVDSISHEMSLTTSLILVSYGLIWLVAESAAQVRLLLSYRIQERLSRVLAVDVLSHLYGLSHSYFIQQKPGALTNVIRKAQFTVPNLVLSLFFHLIPIIFEFVFVIGLMVALYPLFYSVLMTGVLGVFAFITAFSAKSFLKDREKANKIDRDADGKLADWLANYEAVKVFGRKAFAISQSEKELKKKEVAEVVFMGRYVRVQLTQSLILGFGLSLLTYVVGRGVFQGTLSVGDFVLFNGYLLQFLIPLRILGHVFQDVKKALTDMKGVMDILLTQSEIKEAPKPWALSGTQFSVQFENVSFAYNDRSIFQNGSFTVEEGQTALVVGPTGSGKSTIAKLLLRLYDPLDGRILINGMDLKQISFTSLSEKLGWVPQEGYLLNDTIENNLRFVSPGASLKEIQEALARACLSRFIEKLPDGLQTQVGDRGLKLSGGEKQRLSIARLFLQKPRICVFDESTSSLDKKTDLAVQENIREFLPGRTKIIITHRSFTAYQPDIVIQVKKGALECADKEMLITSSPKASLV